jgi:DNA (cytosine-5)-methyltransferase 1
VLTGGMFGLGTHRPRLFETNWLLMPPPPAAPPVGQVGVYGKLDGRRLWTRTDGSELRAARTIEQAQEAMGMPWVSEYDAITEAIPPAMTEYIGRQLLAVVEFRRAPTSEEAP